MDRFANGDLNWADIRRPFFDGFHASLVAYAQAGNDLIVEHIFEDDEMRQDLQQMLGPFWVLWVGIHAPLDVLEQRENQRGDRALGSAGEDFAQVHENMIYDLELDGTADPVTNAARIMAALGC